MRFEYEKIDVDYITRLVRAEDKKGKRVTRVVLSGPEWYRFTRDSRLLSYYRPETPDTERYVVALYEPIIYSAPPSIGSPADKIRTIEIACDRNVPTTLSL